LADKKKSNTSVQLFARLAPAADRSLCWDTYLCIYYWVRLLPCIVEDVTYICNAICIQSIHCELHPFLHFVSITCWCNPASTNKSSIGNDAITRQGVTTATTII
jgi:hypothetical protein